MPQPRCEKCKSTVARQRAWAVTRHCADRCGFRARRVASNCCLTPSSSSRPDHDRARPVARWRPVRCNRWLHVIDSPASSRNTGALRIDDAIGSSCKTILGPSDAGQSHQLLPLQGGGWEGGGGFWRLFRRSNRRLRPIPPLSLPLKGRGRAFMRFFAIGRPETN